MGPWKVKLPISQVLVQKLSPISTIPQLVRHTRYQKFVLMGDPCTTARLFLFSNYDERAVALLEREAGYQLSKQIPGMPETAFVV